MTLLTLPKVQHRSTHKNAFATDIHARGLRVGHYPPQPVSVLGPTPTLSPSFLLGQAIFEPNLSAYKYSNILKPSHPSYLSTYEDGTGRVFRNVGI